MGNRDPRGLPEWEARRKPVWRKAVPRQTRLDVLAAARCPESRCVIEWESAVCWVYYCGRMVGPLIVWAQHRYEQPCL